MVGSVLSTLGVQLLPEAYQFVLFFCIFTFEPFPIGAVVRSRLCVCSDVSGCINCSSVEVGGTDSAVEGYSRRALQYAFAVRMGCTATKWIKMQRLDRARQRLERPKPNDTVGNIARECGYRSLGLFSVDFQQRFHVKPSQLLRESRPE